MARLLILRHGKTELVSETGRDFDRKLVDRGHRNCVDVARYIKGHLSLPDLILCSPAIRAKETKDWVIGEWEKSPVIIEDERIYNASGETLYEVLCEHAGPYETVMIVGHNPGMILLAHLLMGDDGNLAGKDINDYPTTTLADMLFDADNFASLKPESGKLLSLIRPRDMVMVDKKCRLS